MWDNPPRRPHSDGPPAFHAAVRAALLCLGVCSVGTPVMLNPSREKQEAVSIYICHQSNNTELWTSQVLQDLTAPQPKRLERCLLLTLFEYPLCEISLLLYFTFKTYLFISHVSDSFVCFSLSSFVSVRKELYLVKVASKTARRTDYFSLYSGFKSVVCGCNKHLVSVLTNRLTSQRVSMDSGLIPNLKTEQKLRGRFNFQKLPYMWWKVQQKLIVLQLI